jgi:hypothetical protein
LRADRKAARTIRARSLYAAASPSGTAAFDAAQLSDSINLGKAVNDISLFREYFSFYREY